MLISLVHHYPLPELLTMTAEFQNIYCKQANKEIAITVKNKVIPLTVFLFGSPCLFSFSQKQNVKEQSSSPHALLTFFNSPANSTIMEKDGSRVMKGEMKNCDSCWRSQMSSRIKFLLENTQTRGKKSFSIFSN